MTVQTILSIALTLTVFVAAAVACTRMGPGGVESIPSQQNPAAQKIEQRLAIPSSPSPAKLSEFAPVPPMPTPATPEAEPLKSSEVAQVPPMPTPGTPEAEPLKSSEVAQVPPMPTPGTPEAEPAMLREFAPVSPMPTPEVMSDEDEQNAPIQANDVMHANQPLSSYADVSLDERIFRSDVVALVNLQEVTGVTVPIDAGVASTHQAVILFRFDVIEYLKGMGSEVIIMQDPAPSAYATEVQAQYAVDLMLENRITNWDNRGAVVFLSRVSEEDTKGVMAAASQSLYKLAPGNSSHWRVSWNGMSSHLPSPGIWLPIAAAVSSSHDDRGNVQISSDGLELVTDSDPRWDREEFSFLTLGEWRSRIRAMEAIIKEGKDIDGYLRCISERFITDRWIKGWEVVHNGRSYSVPAVEKEISSGLPAGTEIHNAWIAGGEFSRYWLTGTDSELFTVQIVDTDGRVIVPDDRYPVTYHISMKLVRPLPAGTFKYNRHDQPLSWIPCNYEPDEGVRQWNVIVDSPSGTVHEALFDPKGIVGAIGASISVGLLAPRVFRVEGTNIELLRLEWKDGIVTLKLTRNVMFAGHTIDFIGLDGSIVLSLQFDDSTLNNQTGEITWSLPEQPWQDGDQLLIRVHESHLR